MPGIERLIDTWFRDVSKHEDVFTLVRIIADYTGCNCGGVDVDNFYNFLSSAFFCHYHMLEDEKSLVGAVFSPSFLG